MRPNLSSLNQALQRIEEIQGRFAVPRNPEAEVSRKSFARELASLLDPSSSPASRNAEKDVLLSPNLQGHLESLQGQKKREKESPGFAWEEEILQASRESGVPPEMLRAMVQVESAGNPRATSPKGAMGLMQLMPGTARLMGVKDPYDPEESLQGGAAYMARMMKKYANREDLALAAYNAGPGRVDACGGIPPFPETQKYVEKVLSLYQGFLKDGDAPCP
ncbi:MAG TPA: lytic transglycosylase domain-containing protein [Synergistaceae bacterium]|nr:lytic transglycosylase domain-containing protein [Synergistaceae bacterium]HPJ26932.1 lytic transglycosylase domain-containing protein [Synergistaceae bacterium]HPQ37012.1 lytic transglycosylase domain-containing protein [Synergistaceae bacterium]